MSLTYYEDASPNCTIQWKNIQYIHSLTTKRGTTIQMIQRPEWGLTCYMNEAVQSCEVDERLYHEALVHPAMACAYDRKRVMIIGGGEGATAREVFKWLDVEEVDMYDWDEEVVSVFKERYPQWAKGAWGDPRLTLHYDDIFEVIKTPPKHRYDVIIVDLFDFTEEDHDKWDTLLYHLPNWSKGPIGIYAGMRTPLQNIRSDIVVNKKGKLQPYQQLAQMLHQYASPAAILSLSVLTAPLRPFHKKSDDISTEIQLPPQATIHDHFIAEHLFVPYHVFIPSFMGEATFLLIKSRSTTLMFDHVQQISHITKEVWNSYKTFNW